MTERAMSNDANIGAAKEMERMLDPVKCSMDQDLVSNHEWEGLTWKRFGQEGKASNSTHTPQAGTGAVSGATCGERRRRREFVCI